MESSHPNAGVVTINGAAEQIGCKREYIYQLLQRGKISGPAYTGRAPRNAPRVYQSSIDAFLHGRNEREQRRRGSRSRRPGDTASGVAIRDRFEELTRIVQQDRRERRARLDKAAAKLSNLVALQAKNARSQADYAQRNAVVLERAQSAFHEVVDLAGGDDNVIDQVLGGCRDILTTVLRRDDSDGVSIR